MKSLLLSVFLSRDILSLHNVNKCTNEETFIVDNGEFDDDGHTHTIPIYS